MSKIFKMLQTLRKFTVMVNGMYKCVVYIWNFQNAYRLLGNGGRGCYLFLLVITNLAIFASYIEVLMERRYRLQPGI